MENKVKVRFLRPIYPYKSGEIGYIDEKKAKYFKKQVEIIKEQKEVKPEKEVKPGEEVKPVKKRKQVKKKSNKAILNNNNTKWL